MLYMDERKTVDLELDYRLEVTQSHTFWHQSIDHMLL